MSANISLPGYQPLQSDLSICDYSISDNNNDSENSDISLSNNESSLPQLFILSYRPSELIEMDASEESVDLATQEDDDDDDHRSLFEEDDHRSLFEDDEEPARPQLLWPSTTSQRPRTPPNSTGINLCFPNLALPPPPPRVQPQGSSTSSAGTSTPISLDQETQDSSRSSSDPLEVPTGPVKRGRGRPRKTSPRPKTPRPRGRPRRNVSSPTAPTRPVLNGRVQKNPTTGSQNRVYVDRGLPPRASREALPQPPLYLDLPTLGHQISVGKTSWCKHLVFFEKAFATEKDGMIKCAFKQSFEHTQLSDLPINLENFDDIGRDRYFPVLPATVACLDTFLQHNRLPCQEVDTFGGESPGHPLFAFFCYAYVWSIAMTFGLKAGKAKCLYEGYLRPAFSEVDWRTVDEPTVNYGKALYDKATGIYKTLPGRRTYDWSNDGQNARSAEQIARGDRSYEAVNDPRLLRQQQRPIVPRGPNQGANQQSTGSEDAPIYLD